MTNVNAMLKMDGVIRYWSPSLPDDHNDPTDEWTEVKVRCRIQQRTRQEQDEGQVSSTTWWGFFPTTVPPPRSTDELVVDGVTYQFRGDAWLAHGTRGKVDHIEATLVRAE